MKKKGFTLVELLVVIAIIAMLLAILMPALGKVRALAYRLMCGTNLGGIGKALAVYANDYQESYPLRWGAPTLQWDYKNASEFWDLNITTNPTWNWSTQVTKATVTSSLYLLVKYADVSTNQFVCKSGGYKKFELTTSSTDSAKQNYSSSGIKDVTEAWDFGKVIGTPGTGNGSWDYCGYAYQMPYVPTAPAVQFSPSVSSPAGVAMLADASPWFKKGKYVPVVAPTAQSIGTGPYMPTAAEWGIGSTASKDKIKLANSINHSQEGQNVLFGDSHVSFETQSNVGITQDNIYVPWVNASSGSNADQSQVQGATSVLPLSFTKGSFDSTGNDSFLVN